MSNEKFLIPEQAASIENKVMGSKFIGYCFPLQSVNEVKDHLNHIRKKYYDATHHCYAYIWEGTEKASDDGEPAHSAGDPILHQIKSKGVEHTLVVVIRYFGGIKLGVQGLIQAYQTSAHMVLEKTEWKEKWTEKVCELRFPYSELGFIYSLIHRFDAKSLDEKYGDICIFQILIKQAHIRNFTEILPYLVEIQCNDHRF